MIDPQASPVTAAQPRPVEGLLTVKDYMRLAMGPDNPALRVMDDIDLRHEVGKEKYGSYLMTNNGRDADIDLYQELCDACGYASQGLLEECNLETALEKSKELSTLLDLSVKVRNRLVKRGILPE